MNYYFTGALIILFVLLCFMQPAYPRNEYLNEYGVRCGEMEISTEQRETDYNYSDSSTHEDQYLRFTYRKYLGTDCKTSKENVQIRFWEKAKGLYGTKFFSEDNKEPKTGYLRPLMIVIIDRCDFHGKN